MVAVHWDAALEITDVAGGGDVVALMSEQGRSVHLNEREARRRADEEATRFAAGALEAWLHQRIGSNRDEQEENDHE
jgi:hypothetical protein